MPERVRVSRHIVAKIDRRDSVLAILAEHPKRRVAEPGDPAHVAVAICDVAAGGPDRRRFGLLALIQQQPADSEQQRAAGAQG